jgi:hypothetical protein
VAETRSLLLRFYIESDDELASSEFLSLFECVDTMGRAVAEFETARFLETLELPYDYRRDLQQSVVNVGRRLPTPMEIKSVERGSWSVTAVLTGPALLWVAQKFIVSPLLEAWSESRAREKVEEFFRDRVFGGARRVVENRAAQGPTFGNLRIVQVEQIKSSPDQPTLVIRLKRSEIVEVQTSDKQLIEDFLARLSGR